MLGHVHSENFIAPIASADTAEKISEKSPRMSRCITRRPWGLKEFHMMTMMSDTLHEKILSCWDGLFSGAMLVLGSDICFLGLHVPVKFVDDELKKCGKHHE